MDRAPLKRAWLVVAVLAAIAGTPEGAGPARGGGPKAGHYVQRALTAVVSGFPSADLGTGSRTVLAQEDVGPRTRAPITFLQINDVYSTVPVDGLGGLARVATFKQRLAEAGRTPFLVLAGDFLSPSVASATFKGAQMIAALNAAGLDLATLGNHEFDFGDDVLIERMHEANWPWVVSNAVDTNTGRPIGGAAPYLIKTFGALKVGFIGLCLTTSEITADKLTHTRLVDPLAAAGEYLPMLKREGATLIVAVTHLAFADDRALVEKFPEIDLIIGGHEHYLITSTENRTLISKAGSDARFVARIDVNRRPEGTVERFYELVPMASTIPDDPRTAAVIASYETRLSTALQTVVGVSRVPLDADSRHLRSSETNLGDFVADAIHADAGTDIAVINSGSIRGDRVFPAGPLTRRTLVEMHPFDNVICKLALPGRVVLDVLNHGVAKLPAAAGQFPQVSGLTMIVDRSAPAGSRVRDVRVNGQPLDPGKTYTVALPDFILKGGDDYTMLAGQRVLVGPEAGNLVTSALEKYVAATREIAPAIDGRITLR
jgi:2',3'-cyclic-nucleotide 2'-phosphodiesterase (5'-nucleotidase family)